MRSNFSETTPAVPSIASFKPAAAYPVKPVFKYIVILGDSLSDRSTLARRYLFKIIPLANISGLTGKSPSGRFANGYVWSDDISAMFANVFFIRRAQKNYAFSTHKKYKFDSTDIADAIITAPQSNKQPLPAVDITDVSDSVIANRYFRRRLQNSYTLDNDLYVVYHGQQFVRSYDEGGLSSHNYFKTPAASLSLKHPITSFKVFFSRLILAHLDRKRKAMLNQDRQMALTAQHKEETLVIEWSGANDLITVNIAPTQKAADKAIKARIANVEKLIQQGYRKFILFNLPDLSLTPRFQKLTGKDSDQARKIAHDVTAYLNQQLLAESVVLQKKYQSVPINMQVYDVSKLFTAVYADTLNGTKIFPVAFDKDKLRLPFVEAPDFVDSDHLSPASGYMFWNDVHPSADMQALLAEEVYKNICNQYIVSPPDRETAEVLCATFKRKMGSMQGNNLFGCCSFFYTKPIVQIDYRHPEQAIVSILNAASGNHPDKRIRKAVTELGWLDKNGHINTRIAALRKAKAALPKEAPPVGMRMHP